jgi:hypothetical protein
MLHRRTPEAHNGTTAWADTASAQGTPASPVPPLAADASTARIPADPAATVRKAAADLRRRLAARTHHAPDWRAWTDLARGYLALLLAAIPKARPRRTLTVFVASLAERPSHPDPSGIQVDRDNPDGRHPWSRPQPRPDSAP